VPHLTMAYMVLTSRLIESQDDIFYIH